MAEVTLETARILTWEDFHRVSAATFGFPDFYGHNMNAWIDCLSDLELDSGMTRILLAPKEFLHITVPEFEGWALAAPEIAQAFLEAVAFVNRRFDRPLVSLLLG